MINYTLYPYNNKVIAPADLEGVAHLLNSSGSGDLATPDNDSVCKSLRINKFSPYKPINYDKTVPLIDPTEWDYANYGVSIKGNRTTPRRAAQIAINGGRIPQTAQVDTGDAQEITDWLIYDRPKGGLHSPYRLSDFNKYNHNAEHSIWGVHIDIDGFYFFYNGNYDTKMFGTNITKVDGVDFTYMGLLIAMTSKSVSESTELADVGDIYVASSAGNGTHTFEMYELAESEEDTKADYIFKFSNGCIPFTDTLIEAWLIPILCTQDWGNMTIDSNGVPTLVEPAHIDNRQVLNGNMLWDDKSAFPFILLPLMPKKLEKKDFPTTTVPTYLTIDGFSSTLDSIAFNIVRHGNQTITSVKLTLTYNYSNVEYSQVISEYNYSNVAADINVNDSIPDNSGHSSEIDNVVIDVEYVLNGETLKLSSLTKDLTNSGMLEVD